MADNIDSSIDITGCDTEPIHVPGSIQPHGALIALDADLTLVQVSANAAAFLGHSPADLLGQPAASALQTVAGEQTSILLEALRTSGVVQELPVLLGTVGTDTEIPLDVVAHRRADGDGFLIEWEPHRTVEGGDSEAFYRTVNRMLLQLRGAPDRETLYQRTVQEVQNLTGFERVMLYRFHADEHGEVIAEALRDDLTPFMGLHYPASDIPRQARALYVRSQIRLIADVDYIPAPLLARAEMLPLDLTHAALRSVSPVHIQYLKNMGVASSMSISIVQEDRLWGLIACHSSRPRFLSYVDRNACELIGQTVAAQILAWDARTERAERSRAQTILEDISRQLAANIDIGAVLTTATDDARPPLLDLLDASGVAIILPPSKAGAESSIYRAGGTPDEAALHSLITYLNDKPEDIYTTESLPAEFSPAKEYAALASGLLSIAITRGNPAQQAAYLLFFRPEVISTVNWAGDPIKQAAPLAPSAPPGTLPSLTPRQSFALWQQEVYQQSRPWTDSEHESATSLRREVVGALLRRTQTALAALNDDLRRSNDELDAFAYIASHDLREPLRGIRNYSNFLNEDFHAAIGDEGGSMLDTIARLTTRMETFLDSLLHYSRVGSIELARRTTDMNVLVNDVLEILSFELEAKAIKVRIPRRLPTARVDAIRAAEVFTNLIANAIKYTEADDKWIEIGYLDADDPKSANQSTVFYVRDNGIGIEPRNHEAIFLLFRRLHERDKFGGGTGAGLTIVRRIVARHGGRVWVESTRGGGSTFFFTFASEPSQSPAGTETAF